MAFLYALFQTTVLNTLRLNLAVLQKSGDLRMSPVTISPHYPQSNGLAERTVRNVKDMSNKTAASKQDFYLALLNYRASPIENHASPAQLLMSRNLRTIIPICSSQLNPNIVDLGSTHDVRQLRQERQKKYYNRNAKPLKPLMANEHVHMRKEKQWIPATVLYETDEPRSYVVRTEEGGEYRRNRRDLRCNDTQEHNSHSDRGEASKEQDTQLNEGHAGELRPSARITNKPDRLTYFDKGFNGH